VEDPAPQGPEVILEVVVDLVLNLDHGGPPVPLPLGPHPGTPLQARLPLKLLPNMVVVEMTLTMSMIPPRSMTPQKPPPRHYLRTWQLPRLMKEMAMTQLRPWMVRSLLKHWGARGLEASLEEEVEAEVDLVQDQSLDLAPGLKVNLDLVTDPSQDLAPGPTLDLSPDPSLVPGPSQDPSLAQPPGLDLGQGLNLAPEVDLDQDQGAILRARRNK